MKVLSERINKQGKRVQTVMLDKCEHLIAVDEDSFYKLGGQVDDVVRGHVLTEMDEVTWCSIGQEWVS